jgi:hypothetical protein
LEEVRLHAEEHPEISPDTDEIDRNPTAETKIDSSKDESQKTGAATAIR